MRVLEVRVFFKPKYLVVMLAVCAAIAGVAAWVTGLNFWVLGAILVIGVLINGVIMSIEDKDAATKRDD
jgi:hypothetical protein